MANGLWQMAPEGKNCQNRLPIFRPLVAFVYEGEWCIGQGTFRLSSLVALSVIFA